MTVLVVSHPEGHYAVVVEDELGDGNILERLRFAIREKNVPGSTWGALVDNLTPDEYEMVGLRLVEYDPYPIDIDHSEIIVLEDDGIPF